MVVGGQRWRCYHAGSPQRPLPGLQMGALTCFSALMVLIRTPVRLIRTTLVTSFTIIMFFKGMGFKYSHVLRSMGGARASACVFSGDTAIQYNLQSHHLPTPLNLGCHSAPCLASRPLPLSSCFSNCHLQRHPSAAESPPDHFQGFALPCAWPMVWFPHLQVGSSHLLS